MFNKKIPVAIVFFCIFLYMEILFRIFAVSSWFSWNFIFLFFYIIFLSFLFSFCVSFFPQKVSKFLFFAFLFFQTLWYSGEIIFKNSFHVYFSLSTTLFADQALGFASKIFEILFSYWWLILLLFFPFFLCIFFQKCINFEKKMMNASIILLCVSLTSYFIFVGFLQDTSSYLSPNSLYYQVLNNPLNKETFGAFPSIFIEFRKLFFPKKEEIFQIIQDDTVNEDIPIVYEKNILDIPFSSFIEKEEDLKLRSMHEFFMKDVGTIQNKYSGYFKGKNLILIMAESFNSIAVHKELTPTLYKLSHEGFVFENFYSPVILSTIGGEFQELTSLYPDLTLLSKTFRAGTNYFPFGYGKVFQDSGYEIFAYHNHKYQFQDRNQYLASLGFTNYLGCGNGLEKRINCSLWPESDQEMFSATMSDYMFDNKPFFTYYVTVSGHMSYNFKKNDMAIKNQDFVENLPYSTDIKAYLATQIELDRALQNLIVHLEKSGKLKDTVIALVGDHYPYDISLEHINEIANPKRDDIIEINRSHFILWNSEMESVSISKVGGNMDVLPTILNLFDISYDSRLLMGKDLLSPEEGLVIFADSSWISDKGTFLANKGLFIPKDQVQNEDYVKRMNQIVSNRINLSKLILEKDYYKKVLGD